MSAQVNKRGLSHIWLWVQLLCNTGWCSQQMKSKAFWRINLRLRIYATLHPDMRVKQLQPAGSYMLVFSVDSDVEIDCAFRPPRITIWFLIAKQVFHRHGVCLVLVHNNKHRKWKGKETNKLRHMWRLYLNVRCNAKNEHLLCRCCMGK